MDAMYVICFYDAMCNYDIKTHGYLIHNRYHIMNQYQFFEENKTYVNVCYSYVMS